MNPPDQSSQAENSATFRREWAHAPTHLFIPHATYIVTSGTYLKQHIFNTPERLSFLREKLFDHIEQYGWELDAWAVFVNHYHFVAKSPENAESLSPMLQSLNSVTAEALNKADNTPGGKVWWQFRETCLTDQKS